MKVYKIDWEKVKNLEDLKRIIEIFEFRFTENDNLDTIRDLLKETEDYAIVQEN